MTKQDEKIYIEASGHIWEEMGPREALTIAIYNEQAAYDFYSGLVGVIENEGGKIKFKFLADDEKRHRQLLEERYQKEGGGEKFVFDPSKAKKIEVKVDDQTGAIDAVELALEGEKAASEFYKQAAQNTRDKEGRRMFERLAEDEEGHYELLLAEREALLGGPFWFSEGEQRLMEE